MKLCQNEAVIVIIIIIIIIIILLLLLDIVTMQHVPNRWK